jgi:hypothetical protein
VQLVFADCNCFLVPTKRYSGILRTVESRDDNFKIYCLLAVYQPDHFSFVVLFAFLSASTLLALLCYFLSMSFPSFSRRINLCRSLFFRDSAFEILLPWLKESVDSPGSPGKLTRASRKSSVPLSASLSPPRDFPSYRLTLKRIEFSPPGCNDEILLHRERNIASYIVTIIA